MDSIKAKKVLGTPSARHKDRTGRINREVDKRMEQSAGEIYQSRWNDKLGRWEFLVNGEWVIFPVHETLR